MASQLIKGILSVAPDSYIFEDAIHALNLPIGPRVPRLGQAIIDVVPRSAVQKGASAEEPASLYGFFDQRSR